MGSNPFPWALVTEKTVIYQFISMVKFSTQNFQYFALKSIIANKYNQSPPVLDVFFHHIMSAVHHGPLAVASELEDKHMCDPWNPTMFTPNQRGGCCPRHLSQPHTARDLVTPCQELMFWWCAVWVCNCCRSFIIKMNSI